MFFSARPLASITRLIFVAFLLAGCASRYEPVSLDLAKPSGEGIPQYVFFEELVHHLAYQRGDAYAVQYFNRNFFYAGWRATENGHNLIYLFEANPQARTPVPLAPYAYVFFVVTSEAYLKAEHNTAPLASQINDGDGDFQGTYKLTIMNAQYCSGETRKVPVVEGDQVAIEPYDRMFRTSMYYTMVKYITHTYCQGQKDVPENPALSGVRFYFEDARSMQRFARLLVEVFPWLEVR